MPTYGRIFDLREMTVHDGPGIRCTVFFKGCPLRCAWCHNPEGISFEPELMVRRNGCRDCGLCRQSCEHPDCAGLGRCLHRCPLGLVSRAGEDVTAEVLAARMLEVAELLEEGGGGYTLSGGEPLAQADFLFELVGFLRPHHVAIETSGFADPAVFARAIEAVDLIMLDVKHMDSAEHRRGTGVDNELILGNLDRLMSSGRDFIVRIPLIPGYNDSERNLDALAERLEPAKGRCRVELLPYNPFAGAKYALLGRAYPGRRFEGQRPMAGAEPLTRRGLDASLLGRQ